MSAPLYFLPGVFRPQLVQRGRLSAALLESRGLATIFGDLERLESELSLMEITGNGPGGASGTLLVPLVPGGEPPLRLGYYPEQQDWYDVGDYWLGIDREFPPTPVDLARVKQIGGYRMQLAGADWLVPILRRPDASTELPCSYGWTNSGEFTQRVREAYVTIWEETAEVVDWFVMSRIMEVARREMPRIADWCVRILSVNYRFDRALQNALGVVGSDDWLLILAHAIDWYTAAELDPQKKNASHGPTEMCDESPAVGPSNTLPGCMAVAGGDIDPAAVSS